MGGVISDRAQTEPIAALVAVAAVCLALSVYSGIVASMVPEFQSDRDVTSATADRLWHEITETGIYVVDADSSESDPLMDVPPSALPNGYNVAITITIVGDDGRAETVSERLVDGQGTTVSGEVPERAERFERPLTVRRAPGDLQPGTMSVETWE